MLETKDRGLIYSIDRSKGIECHVDASFAGEWDRNDPDNPDNLLSRTGFVISYAGCPIIWMSKLQTEIALSTAEAEYIALSQAMRSVLPLMELMKEINAIFPLYLPEPKMHCKVFEDNNSCISIAESNKFSPRTKHIALKYHHFRRFVREGMIKILPIDTKDQIADIFTKPLDEHLFKSLRLKLSGW